MTCLVQEFLQGGGTIEQLIQRYAIKAKQHERYPNLVLLKYDMINSPMGEPIVAECRGIILDSADNWRIVSRPFDKFWNYGEGHAKPIDWASARVLEKLDGSLMVLYHYDGEWQVSSSGMPDAGGEVNGCDISFRDLFWKVWDEMGYFRPAEAGFMPHMTYMFELMTPYNRVVVRHKENRIALIGVRNRLTGKESKVGWESPDPFLLGRRLPHEVRVFPLQTTEDVLKTFDAMDPLGQEGYVVVDKDFHRIKVKHPGYVAIHHMRDGFGPRRMLEVVRSGESSELLVHFPEWTDVYNEVQGKYEALVTRLEAAYEEHKAEVAQKDFALKVKDLPFSGALFQLRAKKINTVREHLKVINIKNLVEHLNLKDIEF